MRRFFVTLLLIPYIMGTLAAAAESSSIHLSFDAADQTAYSVETTTKIGAELWNAFTNIPAGPARTVLVNVLAADKRRYFRLVSSTNLATKPVLQIRHNEPARVKSLVIPTGTENSFANGSGGLFRGPVDYQVFYSRSNFLGVPRGSLTITGVAFRIDEDTSEIDVLASRVGMFVSTFTNSALSRFRTDNWGHDRTLVYLHENVRFRGVRNLGNPADFQIEIPFDKPFVYDRAKGDLLLDMFSEGPYINRSSGFGDGIIRDDGSIFSIVDGTFGGIFPFGPILKLQFQVEATTK